MRQWHLPAAPGFLARRRNNVSFQTLTYMPALRQPTVSLNPEARRKIGEALRVTYGKTLTDPIPRRHLALLQCLQNDDDAESAKSGKSDTH